MKLTGLRMTTLHQEALNLFLIKTTDYKIRVLHEYITLGQRVKAFNIEVKKGNDWVKVADATTIGLQTDYQNGPVLTDKIRININKPP